jgi:hypothetical protein
MDGGAGRQHIGRFPDNVIGEIAPDTRQSQKQPPQKRGSGRRMRGAQPQPATRLLLWLGREEEQQPVEHAWVGDEPAAGMAALRRHARAKLFA